MVHRLKDKDEKESIEGVLMGKGSEDLKGGFKVNPAKKIKNAIHNEDFLSAFSHAVTYFELFGFVILRKKLRGKISSDKLEKLSVHTIIILLCALEIIEQPTYNTMMVVKTVRNKIIHPEKGIMYEPNDEEKRAISKSVECVEELLEKI